MTELLVIDMAAAITVFILWLTIMDIALLVNAACWYYIVLLIKKIKGPVMPKMHSLMAEGTVVEI